MAHVFLPFTGAGPPLCVLHLVVLIDGSSANKALPSRHVYLDSCWLVPCRPDLRVSRLWTWGGGKVRSAQVRSARLSLFVLFCSLAPLGFGWKNPPTTARNVRSPFQTDWSWGGHRPGMRGRGVSVRQRERRKWDLWPCRGAWMQSKGWF